MDGYKKIKASHALWGLFLAIALIGCKSREIGYVNLYVDGNMLPQKSIADSIEKSVEPIAQVDTAVANYQIIPLEQLVISDTTAVSEVTTPEINKRAVEIPVTSKKIESSELKEEAHSLALETGKKSRLITESITLADSTIIYHDTLFYPEESVYMAEQQQLTNSLLTKIDALLDKIDQFLDVSQGTRTADTIISITEVSVDSPEEHSALQQELLAKNATIEQLRNQLTNQQQAVPQVDTVTIIKEIIVSDSISDTISNSYKFQQIVDDKNDTIQFLKYLLKHQQPIEYITDTVTIFKDILVSDPTPDTIPEFFALQKELNAKNDTIQQLRTQLKKPQPVVQKKDTITFIAYFDSGKTRPKNEIELLKQIKIAVQNKQVEKVILSGHTDSKGSAEINKKLTQQRLEYIHSKIKTIIPIESIFLQNFADTFASKTMVPEERRVEIQIFIK